MDIIIIFIGICFGLFLLSMSYSAIALSIKGVPLVIFNSGWIYARDDFKINKHKGERDG